MKRRIARGSKIGAILRAKRGESLVESVVSIAVFALFALAITTIILSSLRMSAVSQKESNKRQSDINNAQLAQDFGVKKTLKLENDDINVTVEVWCSNDSDVPLSFRPEKEVGTP